MKSRSKVITSLLFGASALILGACSTGESSVSSLEEATANYDSISSGDISMDYDVSSSVYGDYSLKLTGQFTRNAETEVAVNESEESKESSSESKESVESGESTESTESETPEEVKESPSRNYDYHLVENTSVYVDGQETNSTGEVVALGDTLFDKVFLTGSEADGKFVYDSRDAGITEYPVSDYLEITPLIDAFKLEENKVSVEKGELFGGEKGHVFTLTPEQVATSLQGEEGESALGQNILGLVSESEADTVVIGVNDDTFSVEVLSTGTGDESKEPTSEAGEDTKESTKTTDTEENLVGYLVVTKEEGKVGIEKPKNSMDLDEFSALIELYYQQMAEDSLGEQLEDGVIYEDGEAVQETAPEDSGDSKEEQESETSESSDE